MPFTLAHPAAIVPLVRPLGRHAVLSALVIGSLAPDFSYFLPFPMARARSHDLFGLVWFCMPLGLASYALFHSLLARPWLDLLPASLRTRCLALADERIPPALAAIAISLFVGALTHIAWDAFTHAGAPIVRVSRALRFHLGTVSGYPVSVYTILQHLSTAMGFAVLAVVVGRWLRVAAPASEAGRFSLGRRGRRIALVAIAALSLALWLASDRLAPPREPSLRGVQLFLRRAVPAGISSLALMLGAYAVVWQLLARRKPMHE